MKRAFILALALSSAVFIANQSGAQQPSAQQKPAAEPAAAQNKPFPKISVNGSSIPEKRFEIALRQAQAQAAQATQGRELPAELDEVVKEQLINQELIEQEAVRMGLDKNPEVAQMMALARQNVLIQAFVADFSKKNPIKEDQLKADYDRAKKEVGDKEYKPAHILVEKEEDAKAIIAQLKKGADFDKLAKDKSKDTGTKDEGGKLDWVARSARVAKEFTDAMTKLQKGQFTQEPVKTQYGFHVIKLDDVRALKTPSFDEVKDRMRGATQRQQIQKAVAELRQKAKIDEK